MLRPGDIVDGRFEIVREAGRGGMGIVFHGIDKTSGETVALKLLHAKGSTVRDRFLREAEVLAQLDHPAIVRYVAHGTYGPVEQLYLVMEWLEGDELEARLNDGRGLTVTECVSLGRRIAGALAVAHRAGVVHRDIKPSNIFLRSGNLNEVKLLDFGIARAAAAVRMTKTGMALGTPGFMAPEQATGEREIDGRADLFALGALLFEALTGRPAYTGAHAMAILTKVLFQPTPRIDEVRQGLPEPLVDLVASLMARDRNDRPPSAEAAVTAFETLGQLQEFAAPERSSTIAAITDSERRLVNVIIADTTRSVRDTVIATDVPTLESAETIIRDSTRLHALQNTAERYGGSVEVMHDGSVVILLQSEGLPPEQARRAAQCALGLRDVCPDAPVVVATGWVEVGRRTPYGEVIDNAVGMLREPAAPLPGHGVVICDVTRRLLGDRFMVEQEEVGHVLMGQQPRTHNTVVSVLGKVTPCVGRRRELALLDAAFEDCLEDERAIAVLITGGPGIGKSRLRSEFVSRLKASGQDVTLLEARAEQQEDVGTPYGALANMVKRGLHLHDNDPLEERQATLLHHLKLSVKDEAEARKMAAMLGESLGVPFDDIDDDDVLGARNDRQAAGRMMAAAWKRWLTAAVAESDHPVVLIFEDLQWADVGSVKLLDAALEKVRDQSFMVLALARPEISNRFPKLWHRRDVTEVKLHGLSRKAASKLVRSVLGDDVSEGLVARVVDRADGNAFFLEELMRAVAEGPSHSLPDTVLSTIQARLATFDSEARRVLRAASVFGEMFWMSGVSSLLGDARTTGTVRDWLEYLQSEEVIERRTSSTFAGDEEYRFRHALLREAAYASLTESDRVLAHRLAAEWFERQTDTNPKRLARHWDLGGEPERAAHYYFAASEAALLVTADSRVALELAEKGLALAREPRTIAHLQRARVEAHGWTDDLQSASKLALETIHLQEPGSQDWFVVVEIINAGLSAADSLDLLETWILRALQTEPVDATATGRKMIVLCRAAMYALWNGQRELGDNLLEEARDLRAHSSFIFPTLEVWLFYASGVQAMFHRRLGDAYQLMFTTMEIGEQQHDIRAMGGAATVLGSIFLQLGMWEMAAQQLGGVLHALKQAKIPVLGAVPLNNYGTALMMIGDVDKGLEKKAAALAFLSNHPRLRGRILLSRAEALWRLGRAGEAIADARLAIESLHDHPPVLAHGLAVLALCELDVGANNEALTHALNAHNIRQRMKSLEIGDEAVHLARVSALRAAGRGEDAAAAIREANDYIDRTAAHIDDDLMRTSYLTRVPEVVRLRALGA